MLDYREKEGKREKMDEKRINADATRAYMFTLKAQNGIKPKSKGHALTHNPSSYGIAIKWLLYIKGITYAQFAQRYNGTTAQNMNHLINRLDKKRFFAENIDRICEVLTIDFDYFTALCEKIESKMEG